MVDVRQDDRRRQIPDRDVDDSASLVPIVCTGTVTLVPGMLCLTSDRGTAAGG
jgi:hypothetical protein